MFYLVYMSSSYLFFSRKPCKISDYKNFIILRDPGTSQNPKKYPKDTIFIFKASLLCYLVYMSSSYIIFFQKTMQNKWLENFIIVRDPGTFQNIQKNILRIQFSCFKLALCFYLVYMSSSYIFFSRKPCKISDWKTS